MVTGWLANLLAVTATDLGDHSAALIWCLDAEKRGAESGHADLLGWAALTKALIAYYHGEARRSVQLAAGGQMSASFGTAAHARLAAQEMRARAMLGDAEGMARAKLAASRSIHALADGSPAPGGVFSISLGEDPPYTATSLLLAGRYEKAVALTRHLIDARYRPQSQAIDEQPSTYARCLLILGLGQAGLGLIDEACHAGNLALLRGAPAWPTMVLAGRLNRALKRSAPGDTRVIEYENHYMELARKASRTITLPHDNRRAVE